jgi:hypothetical protein
MIRGLVIAAALVMAGPAGAHHWYDADCCSDRDCAPIAADRVSAVDGGYLVELEAGDHPMVVRPTSRWFPFDHPKLRPSQDGDWHVCVMPFYSDSSRTAQIGNGEPICLYMPGAGT